MPWMLLPSCDQERNQAAQDWNRDDSGLGHWLRSNPPVYVCSTTFATLRCLYSSMIKCLCSFRFGSLLMTKSSHLHVHPDCDPGLWISVTIDPEIPRQSFPERCGMNCNTGVVHLVNRNNQNSKKADKQGVCGGTRHRPLIQALGRQGREHTELKVSLCYKPTLRPTWATWNPVSGHNQPNKRTDNGH